MSAWLCNEEHVYELAHFYFKNCQRYKQGNDKLSLRHIARRLWDANNESLAARYGDDYTPMKPNMAQYVPMVTNHFHMAKLADCLDYQSCEFNGWEKSEAFKILESIRVNLLSTHRDYEAAPWGFEPEEYKAKYMPASRG